MKALAIALRMADYTATDHLFSQNTQGRFYVLKVYGMVCLDSLLH